uniref:Mitochondrial of Enoyl-CoA hydratase n=1 Tax=Podospora anserina (strain S / ATCC MYA-4624 / DSM 980 / FGSC 10383) TaxID=515849 RepID=A0A090CVE8_PODAN|nr:Putative Mitochondrial precursor of Enoyl-CoA hydratase [Podospora anserina S mat+]
MDSLKDVKLSLDDSTGVAIIRLDRPAKRNAFSQNTIHELVSALSHLDALDSVRAVILAGNPDGPFCAGMDINELSQLDTLAAHERSFLKDLTDAFAQFTKPIIAAVIGLALGGGFELALAADIIYAADDALFGLPEVKIGTIPGAGGTQRLARALGKHKAMELILTGDSISASELAQYGLVNKVFPRQEVESESIKLARRLATKSAPVLKFGKKAVLTAENTHLEAGMSLEKSLYYSTFDLGDFREGQAAFLEKRSPRFNLG